MHINNNNLIHIQHPIANIQLELQENALNQALLKQLICLALDSYAATDKILAEQIHQDTQKRHGLDYRTPAYYLKLYRARQNLTQLQLARSIGIKQHHLSEMEHNKRVIGKKLAKQIASILNFDYRKLL